MSLNSVVMIGRLTADTELKTTQTGVSVCSFCLAVENGYGDNKTTSFIDCVTWRKTAEFVSKYFAKGQRLLVQGQLQTRTWKDNEGKNRKTVEVVVGKVDFVDSKKDAEGQARKHGGAIVSPEYDEFSDFNEDEGDLPF